MPILEDVLAGMAFLVTQDDGVSPVIRLNRSANTRWRQFDQQRSTSLRCDRWKLGMKCPDLDKIAAAS
jgi:hypothetical protein